MSGVAQAESQQRAAGLASPARARAAAHRILVVPQEGGQLLQAISLLQVSGLDVAQASDQDDALAQHPDANLELEITESMIMEQVDQSIEARRRVRAMGATIAIDYFGTGYRSLSYLARLPVKSLEIDHGFIVGMTAGPERLAIVSSTIALAHSLQLKVVAEGVETEEQARVLASPACDEAQGYLISKPAAPDQIEQLLRGAGARRPAASP